MKNILLLVHDDAGQEARLQAALDVVRAVEGHLICLDVVQVPVLYGDIVSTDAAAILLEDEYIREDRNREMLAERLAGEAVSWEWRNATGDIAEATTSMADWADLI